MSSESMEGATRFHAGAQAGDEYQVVVFGTPGDPLELRELLIEKLGLHPTDAQVRAHLAPGVLPDRLVKSKADELANAIRKLGVNATAVAAAEIPSFEHPELVHRARCLETGLEVIELHGEPECLLPWGEVELISIGYVPLEHVHRYQVVSTALTSAPRPPHEALEVAALSGFEAWIIRREPRQALRIDHNRMNYEYLGDRLTDSSTQNFRLFVGDAVRLAPHTYLTPSTRAFLQHGPLRHYHFDSPEELRRYTIFHLLLLEQMTDK
jgi:hypothetical protein